MAPIISLGPSSHAMVHQQPLHFETKSQGDMWQLRSSFFIFRKPENQQLQFSYFSGVPFSISLSIQAISWMCPLWALLMRLLAGLKGRVFLGLVCWRKTNVCLKDLKEKCIKHHRKSAVAVIVNNTISSPSKALTQERCPSKPILKTSFVGISP